mgnify:CR=1 FL=1
MAKNEKTPVVINDKEYNFEDLSEQQQVLFNHVIDLNRKIGAAQFNLDQLNVGRNAFMQLLEQNLAETPAEAPVEAAEAPAASA